MKKIMFAYAAINALLLAVAFSTFVPSASAASVTMDAIPTACSSAVFRGTAVYSAPETLRISLNGSVVSTFSSGDTTWQVTSTSFGNGQNTVTAEVLNAGNVVIATASQSFAVNCGTINPMSIRQVWGLTGAETPVTAIGTTHTDEFGFADTCYSWFSKGVSGGCMDIRKTDYYRLPIMKHILGR